MNFYLNYFNKKWVHDTKSWCDYWLAAIPSRL